MERREVISQLPNAITIGRIILILPIGYFIVFDSWVIVLVLLLIAGASDLLDGALARGFHWESRFGQVTDPIADKLTFGLVVILLAFKQLYPLWLMLVVIGRDVGILIGAGVYRLMVKRLDVEPSLLSKANTAVQVAIPLLVVIGTQEWLVSQYALQFLNPAGFFIALGFAVISGLDYLFVWSRRALKEWRQSRNARSSTSDIA